MAQPKYRRNTNVARPSPCKYCFAVFTSSGQLASHVPRCSARDGAYERWRAATTAGSRSYQHSHTDATRDALSKWRVAYLAEQQPHGFSHIRWFDCSNIAGEPFVVRGMLELAVGRWLNSSRRLWQRGRYLTYISCDGHRRRYAPDFWLPHENLYIEAKGWYGVADQTKMTAVVETTDANVSIIFQPAVKREYARVRALVKSGEIAPRS